MYNSDYPILQSPPLRVIWAGWQSDTYTLHREGWEIAANEDFQTSTFTKRIRVAMHHPSMKLYGISDGFGFDHLKHREDPNYWKDIVIQMQGVSSDIIITHQGLTPIKMEGFQQIDPEPNYEGMFSDELQTTFKRTRLSQMRLFRPLGSTQTSEIVLTQPSLDEVLDLALSLQAPRQKEIRQEILKRKAMEEAYEDDQNADLKAKLMLVA